jgi:polyisoprenoid-binding protein YceI
MVMAVERWEIDSGHSGIYFSVRHMMLVKVRGEFSRWSGSLVGGSGDLCHASINILIDASSVATGVEERDAHLKSADFLNTVAFPDMTFNGRLCEKLRGNGLRIVGELVALGLVHKMTFRLENTGRMKDPWGHERVGFTAKGSLDRKALGLTWNQPLDAGGFLVGDRVDFEIDVEAVRQDEHRYSQEQIGPKERIKLRFATRNGSWPKGDFTPTGELP